MELKVLEIRHAYARSRFTTTLTPQFPIVRQDTYEHMLFGLKVTKVLLLI